MTFLWHEKYRPQKFSDLTYHPQLSRQLQNLASSQNMPHIIFYGPDGGGKTTRMQCLLQHLYGQNLAIPKRDIYRMKHKNVVIELPIQFSRHHIEMSPSDLKQRDTILLNKFIKDCATNDNLMFDGEKKGGFITIVLYKAEKLSLNAQAALRRSLEKYSQKIRVIMICESTGSLIPAIKSRCLQIRIPAPDCQQIFDTLDHISKAEGFKDQNLIEYISENCSRNLRAAILMLQKAVVTQNFGIDDLKEKWKEIIEQIIQKIMKEQTTGAVKEIRKMYYELLSNNIPADAILEELLIVFLRNLSDDQMKKSLQAKFSAMDVQHKMKQGQKDIIYLELLTIKLMKCVKDN